MTEAPVPTTFELTVNYPLFQEIFAENKWIEKKLNDLKENNKEVYEHSLRVGYLAGELVRHKQLPHSIILTMTKAGLMHDIGKITVPKRLLEGGVLSDEEKREIDRHVRVGYKMVAQEDPATAQIIVGHHEFQKRRYPRKKDRTGESSQLKEMQGVLALADHADSLLSTRSYKKPWTKEEVENSLKEVVNDSELIQFVIEKRSQISPL